MACRYGSVNGLNQKTESLNRWKEGAEQVETEKKKTREMEDGKKRNNARMQSVRGRLE